MKVRIRNLSKRLVIVALDRESIHLGSGETSPALDAAQLVGMQVVDKLVKSNVIAVVPVEDTPATPARKHTVTASRKRAKGQKRSRPSRRTSHE